MKLTYAKIQNPHFEKSLNVLVHIPLPSGSKEFSTLEKNLLIIAAEMQKYSELHNALMKQYNINPTKELKLDKKTDAEFIERETELLKTEFELEDFKYIVPQGTLLSIEQSTIIKTYLQDLIVLPFVIEETKVNNSEEELKPSTPEEEKPKKKTKSSN